MYLQSFIERNNEQAMPKGPQGPCMEDLSVLGEESTVAVEEPQDDSDTTSDNNDGIVTTGFVTSHPRQQRLQGQRQRQQEEQASSSSTSTTDKGNMSLPTDDLTACVTRFEQHVPYATCAQRDWDALQAALQALQDQLKPPKTLQVQAKYLFRDAIPKTMRQPFDHSHLYLHKATYEANAPTEDRSTVVVGSDFVFAGVWDGHGGHQCAEFTQRTVFDHFATAYRDLHQQQQQQQQPKGGTGQQQQQSSLSPMPQSQRIPTALKQAFVRTNRDYYTFARAQNDRPAYFAGTCAVACVLDLSGNSDNSNNNNDGATLYCANLGDSRAVLGTLQRDGTWQTRALSVDHTAENLLERQRIQALHPNDPHVVMDLSKPPTMEQHPNRANDNNKDPDDDDNQSTATSQIPVEPPDWRVKKMAAFTRSIGDLQLKEKNTSALFNSYMPPGNRILPRPGILPHKHATVPTPPYISTEAEVEVVHLPGASHNNNLMNSTHHSTTNPTTTRLHVGNITGQPSFIIIACDGVWDEMTSEEAVDCVGDLLSQYPRSTSSTASSAQQVNIAELFIEKVLEQVVERLRETDPDEADLTLAQLKARPPGKATNVSRSLLHDDITVVIIQLGSSRAFYRGRRGRSGRGLGSKNASMTSLKSLQKALLRQNAHKQASDDPLRALQETLQRNDPDRERVDQQIVNMMDFFDGMPVRHLKILFHALDVDGNGTLDRDEIGRLINQVMLTNVSDEVVNIAFDEMDADGSGAVDFLEFVAFFGHAQNSNKDNKQGSGLNGTYH